MPGPLTNYTYGVNVAAVIAFFLLFLWSVHGLWAYYAKRYRSMISHIGPAGLIAIAVYAVFALAASALILGQNVSSTAATALHALVLTAEAVYLLLIILDDDIRNKCQRTMN